MSCAEIERELVGYHFGLLADDLRAKVEEHLGACPACVRAFIDVKRAIEIAEEPSDPPASPAPSPAARARLRRAVAVELGLAEPAARRRWWEPPVAFALAASIVLLAGMTTTALTSAPPAPPHALGR